MSANDRTAEISPHYAQTPAQVEYQHWDWVLCMGMDYFRGTATAYIARSRHKGQTIKDLIKAHHYVQKAVENFSMLVRSPTPTHKQLLYTHSFVEIHHLTQWEAEMVCLIADGSLEALESAASDIHTHAAYLIATQAEHLSRTRDVPPISTTQQSDALALAEGASDPLSSR